MSDTSRRRITVLLALVVGLSVIVGGAFAAAPTVDTSATTDSAQTSDLTDGSTQTYNDTTASNFSWQADSENSKLEIYQSDELIASFAPANYSYNSSLSNPYFYNVTLADDGSDYEGMDVGAGENATLTFMLINDTTMDSPDHTNVTVTFVNSETQAIVGADDDDTSTAESGYTIPLTDTVFLEADTNPAQVDEETTIADNTSEIRVTMANQSGENAFSAATGDLEDGTLTTFAYVEADDGTILPVFVESEDVDWLDDDATYATVSTDGTVLTIHNVGENYDAGNFDLVATGNENVGLTAAFGMARSAGAGYGDAAMVAGAAGADFNGDPTFE